MGPHHQRRPRRAARGARLRQPQQNYFIGLGGKQTICASHLAAAVYGIENNLGNLITPLRACYNWAEEKFLGRLPDVYLQVVMKRDPQNQLVHTGVFVGDDLETYLQAARLSARSTSSPSTGH